MDKLILIIHEHTESSMATYSILNTQSNGSHHLNWWICYECHTFSCPTHV